MKTTLTTIFFTLLNINMLFSQGIYFDLGGGVGHIKHSEEGKTADFFSKRDNTAANLGVKVGIGFGRYFYITGEFDYINRNIHTEPPKEMYDLTQLYFAPGILIYPAQNVQVAASLGISFGKMDVYWSQIGNMTVVLDEIYDLGADIAYNISFAYDIGQRNGILFGVKYFSSKNSLEGFDKLYGLGHVNSSGLPLSTTYIGAFIKYKFRDKRPMVRQTHTPTTTTTQVIYRPPVSTPPTQTTPTRTLRTDKEVIESGVNRAMQNIPKDSRVLIEVTATNTTTKNKIIDEIEDVLLHQNYRVVTRSELAIIRNEQNLQLSGDVDEETAVEIGKFAGASYIITARVDSTQVRIRVLNVQTGELVGSATEAY